MEILILSIGVAFIAYLWRKVNEDNGVDWSNDRTDMAKLMDAVREKERLKNEVGVKVTRDNKEIEDMEENMNTNNEEWAKSQLKKVDEDTKPVGVKTRELLTGILTKLSCQWEVDETGDLVFHYQGGHFQTSFCDNVPFLYVYFAGIYSVEAYQKDKIERVKELVNKMNRQSSVKMVYVVDPDDGEMWVHIEDFFLLVPEIPYVEDYLQLMLRRFFQLQHNFLSEIERE